MANGFIGRTSKSICNVGVRAGVLERTWGGLGPVVVESNLASIGQAVMAGVTLVTAIFVMKKAVKDYESDKVRPILL